MATTLQLGTMAVTVARKDIKHVHLSVHPPSGRVTISAPEHLSLEALRAFAVAKLGWIRRQQAKLLAQERDAPREYISRESHYVWGQRCLLRVVEADAVPSVEQHHRRLTLTVRPGSGMDRRAAVLDAWYREQLRTAAAELLVTWQRRLRVRADRLFVQRMRTRWGSCNPAAHSIRLNTELAKKPRECLEYILVHELMHLREPTHSERFVALMDQSLPNWRQRRDQLNRLPVRHEGWTE
jgi:predicted metal-dependent hydrolase